MCDCRLHICNAQFPRFRNRRLYANVNGIALCFLISDQLPGPKTVVSNPCQMQVGRMPEGSCAETRETDPSFANHLDRRRNGTRRLLCEIRDVLDLYVRHLAESL